MVNLCLDIILAVSLSLQDYQRIKYIFNDLKRMNFIDSSVIANFEAQLVLKRGNKEEYYRLREQGLRWEKDYLKLAADYAKEGMMADFERISLLGLKAFHPAVSKTLFENTCNYYRKDNQENKLVTLLIERIIQTNEVERKLFFNLKDAALKINKWDSIKNKLLKEFRKRKQYQSVTEVYYFEKDFPSLISLLLDSKVPLEFQREIGRKIMKDKPEEVLKFFLKAIKKQLSIIKPRVNITNSFWTTLEKDVQSVRTIYTFILKTPDLYETFRNRTIKKYPRRRRLRQLF